MTIIAAVIDRENHRAWMGCDTRSTSDGQVFDVSTKITRVGCALIGTCGNPAGARYLRWMARGEPAPGKGDDHASVAEWVDRLASRWPAWAREQHLADKDDGHVPWWALVATPWGIWHLGAWGEVSEHAGTYAAIGAGQLAALGVLWYLSSTSDQAEHLRVAISAAIAHADGCGGRVVIEMVEAPE